MYDRFDAVMDGSTPAALLERDRELRAEADALVERCGVLEILRQYGTPHLSGSYALQLMTWRDLDIYLETAPDVGSFLDLARELGERLSPRRLSYIDHLHFPATEGVTGLYLGVRTDDLPRGGWKMDIWGLAPEVCAERLSYCASLAARIDDAARTAILRIKTEVCRHPAYRDAITSHDVYEAVLTAGAATAEEFWSYVGQRRSGTREQRGQK